MVLAFIGEFQYPSRISAILNMPLHMTIVDNFCEIPGNQKSVLHIHRSSRSSSITRFFEKNQFLLLHIAKIKTKRSTKNQGSDHVVLIVAI
jgi:hypothetical protein